MRFAARTNVHPALPTHALATFASVFGVIFVAELPDKTALAALVLATRHRPLPVFLGTSLALVLQSLIAVIAGSLLAALPTQPVRIGAGLLFLGSAVWMWRRKDDDDEGTKKDAQTFRQQFLTTFGVVFIAEWGDLTQISTAALAARLKAPYLVFWASALALIAVAAIASFVGHRAAKFLDPKRTQKIAAVLFALVGIVMLVDALRPHDGH